jgi:CRP-like cAMP-binding protein
LQVVGKIQPGELVGEVGVLGYIPQPYSSRTTRLSQILRLDRTAFLNHVRQSVGDGAIIMNNFLNVNIPFCAIMIWFSSKIDFHI